MSDNIDKIEAHEYQEVVALWEQSVKATHHFLKEEDILYFKPLILNEYLKALDLRCIKGEGGKILGFLGVAERKIEMLFIHPQARGKGLGKTLLAYAVQALKATKVDVNEDNEQAVGFYKQMGFKTVDRSEEDSFGKPYPILHMELI